MGSVGGIVGEQRICGYITGCTNTGDINSVGTGGNGYGTGGIVGWVRYLKDVNDPETEIIEITDNTNSGTITGCNDAGGIVGVLFNAGVVTGNYNSAATIQGITFASGIVGNVQYQSGQDAYITGEYQITITDNISTTKEESIKATGSTKCVDLYAYINPSPGKSSSDYPYGITFESNSNTFTASVTKDGITTNYRSLEQAIAAAEDGDTITLLTYVTVTEALSVDKSITLDLNGNDLDIGTSTDTDPVTLTISDGATVTINDSDSSAAGIVSNYGLINIKEGILDISELGYTTEDTAGGLMGGFSGEISIGAGSTFVVPDAWETEWNNSLAAAYENNKGNENSVYADCGEDGIWSPNIPTATGSSGIFASAEEGAKVVSGSNAWVCTTAFNKDAGFTDGTLYWSSKSALADDTSTKKLQSAYDESLALTESNYTSESWAAVAAAQAKLAEVLADPYATEAEVEAALTAFNTALAGLSADKTALQSAYDSSLDLTESKYTSESWATLVAAQEAAKKVLDDENATEKEIEDALTALENAMAGLVKVSSNSSGNTGSGSNSGSGSGADSAKAASTDAENDSSAQTGDDMNIMLAVALMLMAAAGITGTAVYGRRKYNR